MLRRVASGLLLLLLVIVTLPRSHHPSVRVVASFGPVSPVHVAELDPTTTSTLAPLPPPSPPVRTSSPRTGGGPVPSGDIWWRLALCESGGRNANTGNGFYGYFQFVPSTWRSLGYEGLPTDYGYETQLEAAQALQARSGWGQWPTCSRKLGLS